MPHSLADLLVHVIFSTKDRRPVISDDLKARLIPYMGAIVKERGGTPHIINGAKDHIHLLASVPTGLSVAELMRFVKGSSSRWVHKEVPTSRNFAWQRGYAAFSVSRSRFQDVHQYIARQEEHHRKISFQEELVAFLKKHEVEYDERYIWS
jgi:REP element-mobilizing transposase RayT